MKAEDSAEGRLSTRGARWEGLATVFADEAADSHHHPSTEPERHSGVCSHSNQQTSKNKPGICLERWQRAGGAAVVIHSYGNILNTFCRTESLRFMQHFYPTIRNILQVFSPVFLAKLLRTQDSAD